MWPQCPAQASSCRLHLCESFCNQADAAKSDLMKQLEQEIGRAEGGCGWQAWRNLASKLERTCFRFRRGQIDRLFFCHILISGICPKAMLRTHELSWSRSFIGTYWKPHGPSSDHGQSWPKEMNRQGEQFREQLEFLMQATEMLKRRLREMTKNQILWQHRLYRFDGFEGTKITRQRHRVEN